MKKVFEILLTMVIASVMSVITTFYIQSRSGPKLVLDYAWAIALTEQIQSEENEFGTFAIDLRTQSIIRGTAYKIKFEPKNGFSYTPNIRGYLGKMIIVNEGRTTATDVRIGIGYMFVTDFSISVSPNVHAVLRSTDSTNQVEVNTAFPMRREIQIEVLPPGEKAFITLSWKLTSSTKDALGETPEPNSWYIPEILYLTSKETLGTISSFLPYDIISQTEGLSLSHSKQHFWDSGLYVNEGTVLYMEQITDNDKIKIEVKAGPLHSINPSAPFGRR